MNLGTLTTLTAGMAGDPAQSRYSGLYTQYLNLAQQQFALDAMCLWKDAAAQAIVSAQADYDLPTDFILEKFVTLDGIALDPVRRKELLRLYTATRWDQVTGTPNRFITDPEEARKKLRVFPIPTAADVGKSLYLTYHCLPADMAAATDTPLNSSALLAQYHIGLAAWAGWLLLQNETVTPELRAKRDDLLQIYNDQVSNCRDFFRTTASAPLQMRGARAT